MKKFLFPLLVGSSLSIALAAPANAAATANAAEPELQDIPVLDDANAVADQQIAPLLDLPLEDLLTLESTSVAKKRQRVSESAAAVYVITQEEIRRSAASSIPDLLRMVPGVEVGNQNTGGTAVSIRGFNSRLTNSLLVMIDGRSVYVSTLSGVFWDQLLLPLSDIERIEVVRGPGAALWGANASNGVINIITRHSAETLGATANARASTRKQEVSLSHGGRLSDTATFRVFGDVRREKGVVDAQGNDLSRRWTGKSAGARIDWEPSAQDAFTVQGDYADSKYDTPFALIRANLLNPGYDLVQTEGGFNTFNVLGRWTRRQNDSLDWSLQAHYDRVDRVEFGGANLIWQMADVDFGLHWQAGKVHDINIGVGARYIHDRVIGTTNFYFDQFQAADRWVSGYVQDDISLIPGKLRLTLGTKLEHNNFTGFELQPSAKLFFRPNPALAMWASVSRAVRTPSRFERTAHLSLQVDLPGTPTNPYPIPVYSRLNGAAGRLSETMIAYEAGIRAQLSKGWSLDISGYYNRYQKLTAIEFSGVTPLFVQPIPFPVALRADLSFTGNGGAETWGVEAVVAGRITPWWKVEATYSGFHFNVPPMAGTQQLPQLLFPLQGSPTHQAALRNSFDLSDRVAVNTQLRHVSSLYDGAVPAYTSADIRVSWQPTDALEVSLIGENLLKPRHAEFFQPYYLTPLAHTPRTVSAELRLRF